MKHICKWCKGRN